MPITFDRNRTTTEKCEYLDLVSSAEEAKALGGNMVLFFTVDDPTASDQDEPDTQDTWGAGKALRCPDDLVRKFAAESPPAAGARRP